MIIPLQDQDQMKSVIDQAGPVAMAFVVALGIAVFLIWKSMSKQMKRIDPNLPKGVDETRRAQDQQFTEEAVERGEEQAAQADAERGEDEQPAS